MGDHPTIPKGFGSPVGEDANRRLKADTRAIWALGD